MKRELNLFARLVDPPLDGRERDLERLRDLRVREADDVAKQQRHLEVGVQPLDRSPDGVDGLGALGGRVDDLERGNVLELDDCARTALDRAKLVEHPVLRHLEEPGREPRAQREAGSPWKTRRKTSCVRSSAEVAVAGQPDDVVEDGLLVRPDDDREGALVATLGLAQDSEVWLRKRHGRGEYRVGVVRDLSRVFTTALRADFPVISAGIGTSSIARMVGARSESSPSGGAQRVVRDDERDGIRRVRRVRAHPVGLEHDLSVSVIGRYQTHAAGFLHAREDLPRQRSASSTAVTTAGIEPVCPTMSGFAKFTTANR